ncbi:S8 family serine peptidase [Marinobacter sp. HN1S83]|uniref:S8 family serine peptidase n=1 Tax=Marinobacter sp. HN1S83 TaxID=3382301 RepID=UPI00387B821F
MATERLGIGGLLLAGLLSGCGGGGGGGSSSDEAAPDISGVISLESRTRVDLDTADDIRVGLAGDNGSRNTSQALPNTAVVGGYLSSSRGTYNTNTADDFEYFSDRNDIYAAELSEGDRINFQVFESPASYFPLGTLPPQRSMKVIDADSGQTVFTLSESTGSLPISTVLGAGFEEGAYFIELSTSGGAPFRYVLTLASGSSTSVMNTRYAEPDFLVDEAIVTFKPEAVSGQGGLAIAQAMSANEARHLGGHSWRVRRNEGQAVAALSAQTPGSKRRETLSWIRQLGERADVEVAEPNYIYTAQQINPDDDDLYPRQWNYPLIQLPLAWQAAPEGGQGVGIAVMDTGLFRDTPSASGDWHPDIDANVDIVTGQIMDYVSAELDIDSRWGDPDGRDTNPADPGDGKAQSSSFHGTHVAGIAGAVDNIDGVIGVAPLSRILPVRVLGEGGEGNGADLIDAINWAATRSEIDVINLSLGGLGPSQSLEAAINSATDAGKLVVAAAGNQGTDEATYPAAFDNVVGVGAVDGAGERSSYSNIGPSVDLVAPGGDASRDANQDGVADVIISTWGTDDGGNFVPGYAGLQGTSMAAPHVAGVYALMKSVDATMTPDRFFTFLVGGQLTNPPPNQTEYGAGMIDALKSVDAALDGNTSTILAARPSSLQFNGVINQQEFTFAKYPSDANITIDNVTESASWLSVGLEEPPVPVNASEPVIVSVDTAGLDQSQSYSAEIVIDYSSSEGAAERPLTIPVTLQFGGSPEDLDAGRHYVLLVSTDDDRETIAQTVVNVAEGQYQFAFDDVAPGEYFLVAGTDMDNNGLICENGEACAEYPVNGLPEKIVIGGEPLAGVTLTTSFRRPTIAAMGMPRYGFEGYRLKTDSGDQDEPVRQVETDR